MAGRALRSTPSNAGDLSIFQSAMMTKVDELWELHQTNRTTMVTEVTDYQNKFCGIDQMSNLKDLHVKVLQRVGKTEVEATEFTTALFQGRMGNEDGLRWLCPSLFSYRNDSLWRGPPANGTVRKLAKSMIGSGFRKDSCIASRTLDLNAAQGSGDQVSFHLLLGDGCSRAIAACLVWKMLSENVDEIPFHDPIVSKVILSLLCMQVNFERHGTGTPREALVAQASRQNQAAAVMPVNSIQWIGMTREYTGIKIGAHVGSTAQLQKCLEGRISEYNEHPEIDAYDREVIPLRKKRKKAAMAQDEDRDIGLKIGRRRLLAMIAFLAGATEDVYHALTIHMCVVGDYKASVLSDDILMLKWLYVGSKLPKEMMPCPCDIAARDAVSEATLKLIPLGATTAEIRFDTILTEEECLLLFNKMIKIYESDIEDLDTIESKVKCRPSM